MGEKIGRMLNKETSRGQNARETEEETTIEGLKKKYPWSMPSHHAVELAEPSEKTEDTVLLCESRNTRV